MFKFAAYLFRKSLGFHFRGRGVAFAFLIMATVPPVKRDRTDRSPNGSPNQPRESVEDILSSIDTKLFSLDKRLGGVESLCLEIQALRVSLESTQLDVAQLTTDNSALKRDLGALQEQVVLLSNDNRKINEAMLAIQTRSMRDNLLFFGIPERHQENAEDTVKVFMKQHLHLPDRVVENITFHRAHRMGTVSNDDETGPADSSAPTSEPARSKGPRPIVVKFEHYQQKILVRSKGKELKDSGFGMDDQFPSEILKRRKKLFPIRKELVKKKIKAVISVDRLYVNGQLYRDSVITPWLY